MKHINVALFVPDEGCPNRCSFCNQKTISGRTKKLLPKDVHSAVEIALKTGSSSAQSEIAFFGGSFTGIERDYMISLLESAWTYVQKGLFKGIRISTRPDYISEEILEILKNYGVSSIELGCQSMDDRVLLLNGRGHSSLDTVKASKLIKGCGFELGVQMMTGLYGDDDEGAVETAKKLIALSPDTARIYPTIVLKNTELCELYEKGEYKVQSLSHTVKLCSKLLLMFHENNIKVIRLGLHSGGSVDKGYVAGAYHPAFRELCESEIYFEKAAEKLKGLSGTITLEVNSREISKMTGQKRGNIERFSRLGYEIKVAGSDALEKYEVKIKG